MAIENGFARVWKAFPILFFIFFGSSTQVLAQQTSTLALTSSMNGNPVPATSQLPDAPNSHLPQPQKTSSSDASEPPPVESNEGKQTKRILGIVPNFRSVSVNSHLPAQTPKEKLTGFAQDSFDYSSFIFVGLLSAESQIQGSSPEFHSGAPAFGRYYWHTFADQADENFWVAFLLPVALHQDPRLYTLGSGTADRHNGIVKRTGYAFSRILITRTDSGGNNFNFSEVVGSGASAGIAYFYYPSSNRTWTKTGQRWALNVGIDGATFIFKEFWPDINHAIFHNK